MNNDLEEKVTNIIKFAATNILNIGQGNKSNVDAILSKSDYFGHTVMNKVMKRLLFWENFDVSNNIVLNFPIKQGDLITNVFDYEEDFIDSYVSYDDFNNGDMKNITKFIGNVALKKSK